MKLKYYLRGLGIGILMTALIMGVTNRKQLPLTDAEIKAKAATLGMIESDSLTLLDVQNLQNTVNSNKTDNAETNSSDRETAEQETVEQEVTEPEIQVQEKTEAESEIQEPESENLNSVLITIKSGSGSETVCRQLEAEGLVERSEDFNNYLIKNGYATRISVGTFEIGSGSTWEEIAKIITKSK